MLRAPVHSPNPFLPRFLHHLHQSDQQNHPHHSPDPSIQVFKWMSQQQWFRFDFSLATKLADYMGKEGKHAKCRELFNDIINQGRVPFESTFNILIVAYLSASGEDCLQEACDMYQQMIQRRELSGS
ncbi:hypothetical protein Drorol1_Dr00014912 [Drosera rotundifolia]